MKIRTKKVTILVLNDIADQFIFDLGKLGIIHLEELKEEKYVGFKRKIVREKIIYADLINRLNRLANEYKVDLSEIEKNKFEFTGKLNIDKAKKKIKYYEDILHRLKLEALSEEEKTEEEKFRDYMDKLNKVKEKFRAEASQLLTHLKYSYRVSVVEEKLLSSEYITLLQGWIPENEISRFSFFLDDFRKKISKGIAVFYEEDEKEFEVEVPVVYKTSKLTEGFASLIRQYGIPSPRDQDPTLLAGLLWSFMFGFMFADFGEGLVLILLGVYGIISNKKILGIPLKKVGKLLISGGLFSVIFGLLVGEFFLTEVEPLFPGLTMGWIEHSENIIWLLKIAVFIGMIEILVGMILNTIKNLRHGEIREALLSEHGVAGIIGYISFIFIAFMFLGGITIIPGVLRIDQSTFGTLWYLPFIGFLGGIVLVMLNPILEGEGAGMGFGVVLETLISYMANTLSYARLAGFAVAHAAFAVVVETLLKANLMIGILLGLVFLNAFALTLEVVIVMIQSLRLTFYEFLTKFYEGQELLYFL